MRYFRRDIGNGSKAIEITKAEARGSLTGYWQEKVLDEIFCYEYSFRLNTPHSVIWTKDEEGKVPMAGFYGICL